MSDTTTNPEKPVNDGGGGTAPQSDTDSTEEQATTNTQVSQGGSSD